MKATTSPMHSKSLDPGASRIKPLLKPNKKSISTDEARSQLLENEENYSKRLYKVEETLDDTVKKIHRVGDSIDGLATRLDALLDRLLLPFPADEVSAINNLAIESINLDESGIKQVDDTYDSDQDGIVGNNGPAIENDLLEKLDNYLSDDSMYLAVDETNVDSVKMHDLEEKQGQEGGVTIIHNDSDAWRINPKNRFRLVWDICIVMPMLLYLCVAMPFRLCFGNEAKLYTPIYYFEFIIDMIFLVDICFNFFTGYFVGREDLDNEFIEYDLGCIAKKYLMGWFTIDVSSGIPFSLIDLAFDQDSSSLGFLKSFKLLRFLRFLKLGRLLKFEKIFASMDREVVDDVQDFLQRSDTRTVFTLIRLAMIFGLVAHFMACGFVLVARISILEGQHSWLDNNLHGPFSASDLSGENGSGKVSAAYIGAYYFCITTMTSVGYGDILPTSNSECIYTMCLQFIGAIVSATIIGSLTAVISAMDTNARNTAEELEGVSSFVEVRQFEAGLGKRIRRHFRHFYSLKSAIDESKILSELSSSLRKEVSDYLVVEIMGKESFFMSIPKSLWSGLLPLLRPMRFEPGEVAAKAGDDCFEMLVVVSGELTGETKYELEEGGQSLTEGMSESSKQRVTRTQLRTISSGGTINVLCLLKLWNKCLEQVKALNAVETYAVSCEDFVGLFQGTNAEVFQVLQIKESFNFYMDKSKISNEAPLGQPIYFICYSSLEVKLSSIKVRTKLQKHVIESNSRHHGSKTHQEGDEVSHHRSAASHTPHHAYENGLVECWLVVQLIDNDEVPYGECWRFQTETHLIQMDDGLHEFTLNDKILWQDIAAPFHECNMRIRVFEASSGYDTFCGELVVPLTSIDSDLFPNSKEKRQSLELGTSSIKVKYMPLHDSLDEELKAGEIEGIFPLELSHTDSSQISHRRFKSQRQDSFKNRHFDKVTNNDHLRKHRKHLKNKSSEQKHSGGASGDDENDSASLLNSVDNDDLSANTRDTDHTSILTERDLRAHQYTLHLKLLAHRSEKEKSKERAILRKKAQLEYAAHLAANPIQSPKSRSPKQPYSPVSQ